MPAASFHTVWSNTVRHVSMALLTLSLGISGSFVGVEASQAQNLALPKGSSLAATPPIDQRGKQFRAMSRSQRRIYVRQGYRGAGWRSYR